MAAACIRYGVICYIWYSMAEYETICVPICDQLSHAIFPGRLWSFVSLRPEVSGINITSTEFLVLLIRYKSCELFLYDAENPVISAKISSFDYFQE